jgi:hypothetical protein
MKRRLYLKPKLYYVRRSAGQSVLVPGTHLKPATNLSPLQKQYSLRRYEFMDVVSWDMTSCGSSKNNRRFEGTYRFHLQSNKTVPSSQRGSVSRRPAKRASCSGNSTVVSFRYHRIIVVGPLDRRMCLH